MSIKKFSWGKLSSILVFEIIKMSNFPLTCSSRNSNLFPIEFIFECAKIGLSMLSQGIFFSVVLQQLYILAEVFNQIYTPQEQSVGYLFQIVNKNCLENQTSSLCEKVKLYAIAVTMYGPK